MESVTSLGTVAYLWFHKGDQIFTGHYSSAYTKVVKPCFPIFSYGETTKLLAKGAWLNGLHKYATGHCLWKFQQCTGRDCLGDEMKLEEFSREVPTMDAGLLAYPTVPDWSWDQLIESSGPIDRGGHITCHSVHQSPLASYHHPTYQQHGTQLGAAFGTAWLNYHGWSAGKWSRSPDCRSLLHNWTGFIYIQKINIK